jgi:hypothetical protein
LLVDQFLAAAAGEAVAQETRSEDYKRTGKLKGWP